LGSIVFYPQDFSNMTITITTGGEQTGYPKENLEDGNWNTTWMNALDTEEVTIDIDLGADYVCTYFALGNHNLTNTGRGIKVAYDDNNNGAYAALGYVVGSAGIFHDYTSADEDIWIETFAASSFRYWRLIIEDLAGTKPEIGVISLLVKYTMGLNYSLGASLGEFYGTEKRVTTGGQVKSNQNHGVKNRFQLPFDDIDETDKGYFDNIMDQIQGSLYPLFFTDIDGTHYYVRKQEENNFHDLVEHELYNKQWILIEEN